MRYTTPENWAEYFEKAEGVQICNMTIRRRLSEAGKIGESGRNKIGRILKNAFYSEADVRLACADNLQPLLHADGSGFFMKDGQKYGTIGAWQEALGISPRAIKNRLKKAFKIGMKGKTRSGVVREFYSESTIRTVCADLIQDIPHADETGFFTKDGEKYGTVSDLANAIKISQSAIFDRIKTHKIQSIKGKGKSGQVSDFYSESVIRQVCADLLQPLPEADDEGFFEKEGMKYGTIYAWRKPLGITQFAIVARVKAHNPQGIKGKDKVGRICSFYPESVIRQICSDLLQPMPQSDENGLFVLGGETYGTREALPKALGISKRLIIRHIKTTGFKGIKGKDAGGNVRDFYPESAIRQICADLLAKRNNS